MALETTSSVTEFLRQFLTTMLQQSDISNFLIEVADGVF